MFDVILEDVMVKILVLISMLSCLGFTSCAVGRNWCWGYNKSYPLQSNWSPLGSHVQLAKSIETQNWLFNTNVDFSYYRYVSICCLASLIFNCVLEFWKCLSLNTCHCRICPDWGLWSVDVLDCSWSRRLLHWPAH